MQKTVLSGAVVGAIVMILVLLEIVASQREVVALALRILWVA